MATHSAIGLALAQAALEELPPKKRLRILKRATEILGSPGVVPMTSKSAGSDLEAERAVWAKLLPMLMTG